jgi:hypothetical protein
VFAIALQRVAGARAFGMPRLLLSLGAALTLWWGAIQLEQIAALLDLLKDSYRSEQAMRSMQWFSIAGPVAATLGMALLGSAIASFAWHRGDRELRSAATGHTIAFLAITLASIGAQSLLHEATSVVSALAMLVVASFAAIVGLLVLARLLARAAESIEATPELPPARVV